MEEETAETQVELDHHSPSQPNEQTEVWNVSDSD